MLYLTYSKFFDKRSVRMNIINAIINLVNNPITHLTDEYQGRNRANLAGKALEEFAKDLFAGSFHLNGHERETELRKIFSYTGNANNPPDAMLKDGDAIEVKKIESDNASLALNSSHPKHKLYASSTLISDACREAENWIEKDIIYLVGVVKSNELKHLCFVYGADYCANDDVYLRAKNDIKNSIENGSTLDLSNTNEIGRVNNVDPLEITYLRVRGMWHIENPWKVFSYVYQRDKKNRFSFMAIINENKWKSFDNTNELLSIQNERLKITDIEIKDPNNPMKLKNAKLVTYYI